MKIKKDSKVEISHRNFGTFQAIAVKAVDFEKVGYGDFKLLQSVQGRANLYAEGEVIPISAEFAKFEILEEPPKKSTKETTSTEETEASEDNSQKT